VKLASWNVNSISAREERLLAWLAKREPDVVCLQELKATDSAFPHAALERVGYRAAVLGQPTYNGVAILARSGIEDVTRGFGDGEADAQARLIGARVSGLRVASVYVPNGESVGSDKWAYKLAWLARLRAWLERSCDPGEPLVLCGDFNVAPDDIDVANPDRWRNTVLCHPDGRRALGELVAWGLFDAFRTLHPEERAYSWWDYRELGFPRNDGLRIDQLWVTGPLVERLRSAEIDRNERKGARPSDHAPVVAAFEPWASSHAR
jgi:exodeoxyribonuclease-3